MMVSSYMGFMCMKNIAAPIEQPNLRTGAGHGHPRKFNRERPEKNAKAKKHKRTKLRKASRKKNRRG